MIVIHGPSGKSSESLVLNNMFRARKEVFVDLLNWQVPVVDGQFEVDQFDDEHATYIVIADGAGAHLASARLLPSNRPHILDSLFPELCEGPVPRGRDIVEITRFCLDRRLGAKHRLAARNRLVSALVAFALDHKIHMFTGVAEIGWFQQVLAFGWHCRPLGLPRPLQCGTLGALLIEVGPETPGLLRANGIWPADPVRQNLAVAA